MNSAGDGKLRVHYLQHVPFEGLGSIEPVLREAGHGLARTQLFAGQALPAAGDFDWLIVMGGPMGVGDGEKYPWLAAEKAFVRRAIDEGKIVLGICLGAQIIADALGARVYKNPQREIGWFPIRRNPLAEETALAGALPRETLAFHWHGETFDLPEGAVPLASSEACLNQGFIYKGRVVGFQFHLETTPASAAALIENCPADLDRTACVQSPEEMLRDPERFKVINGLMKGVLERMEKETPRTS